MNATLESVNVGQPRVVAEPERWTTAIFKEPIDEPVELGVHNLAGDQQADLSVHGGLDKAVCVYSADHIGAWQRELSTSEWRAAAAGENFTVAGQTETSVCIGDVFEIGSAIVQISQPRSPCWKLARRWRRPDLPKRVLRSGRTGWYLRVLRPGRLQAHEVLRLVDRPYQEWTIDRVNRLTYTPRRLRDPILAARLASCSALAIGWRRALVDD
jgi:MOSC domain-containing protein YiiM